MTKSKFGKHFLLFLFVLCACIAVILGLCLFFLGKKSVSEKPANLRVEQIEDDYFLTADLNYDYDFKFKLELFQDGQYFLIKTVDSKTNSINLSKHDVIVSAGQKYRFSACFTKEKSAVVGEYSSALEWQPSIILNEIDYNYVNFDEANQIISWRGLNFADEYYVNCVDVDGNVKRFSATSCQLNLNELGVGKYRVFITGHSNDKFIDDAFAGKGVEIVIVRKNIISQFSANGDGQITIVSSQKVDAFEIFVDDVLKASFIVSDFEVEGKNFVYTTNLDFLLKQISADSVVKVKSLGTNYVLESEFKELSSQIL